MAFYSGCSFTNEVHKPHAYFNTVGVRDDSDTQTRLYIAVTSYYLPLKRFDWCMDTNSDYTFKGGEVFNRYGKNFEGISSRVADNLRRHEAHVSPL